MKANTILLSKTNAHVALYVLIRSQEILLQVTESNEALKLRNENAFFNIYKGVARGRVDRPNWEENFEKSAKTQGKS